MLTLKKLTTEFQNSPVGIDEPSPRFSWILQASDKNTLQSEYRIRVSNGEETVWDSGTVKDSQSVLIPYAGAPLLARTTYTLRVTVADNHGERAEAEGSFETGLLDAENIKASWITYQTEPDALPVYRKQFSLDGKVKNARLYASALGVYGVTLNGGKAGDSCLAPGWTSYPHRIHYQVYDVTELLHKENELRITVGKGWYTGPFGFTNTPNNYGDTTAAIAQLEITFEDGRAQTLVTDGSWEYGTGSVKRGEIYDGETIDHTAAYSAIGTVKLFDHTVDILTAQKNEPVRVKQRIKPRKVFTTPKGEVVLDFGQNLVGVIEAELDCPRGTEVTLHHAEVLDKDGNFYTENLRAARAVDTFICGGGKELFHPEFTFHGFRYAQVEGLGEAFDINSFTACVMFSDMEEIGSFRCSHKKVNRLWDNIRWGQRGNFLDVPTDCPQRDERLGWTGDAQVFASTAATIMNTALFFEKWLIDLKSEQTAEHGVPHIIPNIMGNVEGAAAWSDAATIIPWQLYEAYGDVRVLQTQYESMKGWVEYIRGKAGMSCLWQSGFQYGDWLALDKEEFADRTGATDVYLVATAYYALSTELVAKTARVLGLEDDAKAYEALHWDIVRAFRREYITETGRMASETQTACVLALYFHLAADKHRERILQTLKTNIQKHNGHLVTGFVGTPYLCHLLSDSGLHDVAGEIFLKEDFPSWLNCVNLGATTIWERWDSMKADGSFDESGMNSFNHYAYGAIGSWMMQTLAGLKPLQPGYKEISVQPMPIKGITHVSASLETPYGLLSCAWRCENKQMTVEVTVPANTSAQIKLPEKDETISVGSGRYSYTYATTLELAKERYSRESTLGELLENPAAKPYLENIMPGMTDNDMIKLAYPMTVTQMSANMPPGADAVFDGLIAELNRLETEL